MSNWEIHTQFSVLLMDAWVILFCIALPCYLLFR